MRPPEGSLSVLIVTLEHPDIHHLLAAVGWLELGNPDEAMLDLERIAAAHRDHPDVLEVKWTIQSKQSDWEQCIETATKLTEVAPQRTFGWIHLSYALHELKRTREAYNNLKVVLSQFPEDWLMRYNMASYACQLGSLEEARTWLDDAISKGDREEINEMAQSDPDLAPLFE